jgi:single-stranded DNA-binding protein
MIDALVNGRIHSKPQKRISKNGSDFVTCKLVTAARDGEHFFVNVIGFDASVCSALLALDAGDAVSIAGEATPTAWIDQEGQPRGGLSVVAKLTMSAYQISKKRKASAAPESHLPKERAHNIDQWESSLPNGSNALDF